MSQHKDLVAKEIQIAFDDVPYPGDINIVTTTDYVNLEADAIGNFLKGKHWSKLDGEKIISEYKGDGSAILSFLTHDAFHFFYPGFLMISLYDFLKFDLVSSASFMLFRSVSSKSLETNYLRRERRGLLTIEQIKATQSVFLTVQDEIGKGLDDLVDEAVKNISKIVEGKNVS